VFDLFVPAGEVGAVFWVEDCLAHTAPGEVRDGIPVIPEGQQDELHTIVASAGAKE